MVECARYAEVAELADALRSGRSGRTPMWVQLPPSAPDPGSAGSFFRAAGSHVLHLTFSDACGILELEVFVTHIRIRSASPFRLLALVLMGLIILYLGVGFVRQANVSHQRREELHRLERDIESIRQVNARLEGRLTYVQSPEAAEEWARQNGWAKEDEVSVVVVAPAAQASPSGGQGPAEEAAPGSIRQAWWDLLFGER